MIVPPIFIFYKDQMIVTDKTEIAGRKEPDFLKDIEVFDASGLRLAVSSSPSRIILSEGNGAEAHPPDLKGKILAFWQSSGNPVPGMREMDLEEAVKSSVEWLKVREWQVYRRGSRLFWTMMLPCGLVPFAVGLFKIPMNPRTLAIYCGFFLGSILFITWLHRTLYARPRFSDPRSIS